MSDTESIEESPKTPAETPERTGAPSEGRALRIRPTDDLLDPDALSPQVRRLHQLGATDDPSLLDRLRGRTRTPPTVEVLLVSTGDGDPLEYVIRVDDSDAVDALERVLRGAFPGTYEVDRVTDERTSVDDLLVDRPPDELAAVEYQGRPERPADWQTRLTPFAELHAGDEPHGPLAAVAETMAASSVPMVYQALLRPMHDWSRRVEDRRVALEAAQDTLGDQIVGAIVGAPDEDYDPPPADQSRLAELDERDPRHAFAVNARAVAVGGDAATAAVRDLASAFAPVGHTCYEIEGRVRTGGDAEAVWAAIRERTFHPPRYERIVARLPFTSTACPSIVADPAEMPSFCLLGGGALEAAGARAVGPTPGERSALPRPPFEQLERYRGDGMVLGTPLSGDGTPDDQPLVLPPALQPLHVAWVGRTGSGKSTSLVNAILANHAATDGADVIIDPKGDGMAEAYCRAHHTTYGGVEDVLYFDCSEVLPAFSFFDIREELAAGVPRPTAVEDVVDHYVEILTQIMGRDRFEQAVRSPDVIRYLVKAMFDPIHGGDAFAHDDLHGVARRMHERQSAPTVADGDLQRMLNGVVANRARSFDEIMQGVANRIEKIPVDRRLARVFNHIAGEGDPHFDLADYLDEDVVIVIDTGELRSEAQRVLALVVLSNLWTALRRRSRRGEGDQPLVNVYVEEAASVAVSDLLKQLLAQSRGFDCSVTLSMQFPAQLRGDDETVYEEILNNVSTIVTGNVPHDRRLAERLAHADMDAQAVGNRLRALRRGEWLVSLPAGFDEAAPRPFLVESAAPPPGDPAGDQALGVEAEQDFQEWFTNVRERTVEEAGVTLGEPSEAGTTDQEEEGDEDEEADRASSVRTDSALPHTQRLPPTVEYDAESHALRCTECDTRYDPSSEGMKQAIECGSSLAKVDRDDVPVCDVNLKLSPAEVMDADWLVQQLLFLQAVYNAQQLRYDPLGYDLLRDSMIRLQEYVGVDGDEVENLEDAKLLNHDTDHPHRLYTVTSSGRHVIGESYREGIDYGHGKGDLEETSQHVFAVEVGRRYLEQEFVDDPTSPVVTVVPYYELDEETPVAVPAAAAMSGGNADELDQDAGRIDRRRLDVAGLDDEGDVVVAVEAERINNDFRRAVPHDFDKIADCDAEEAIWIVMSREAGHEVLAALNEPPEGEPRVEKTYSQNTPPRQFTVDTPGLTAIYTVEELRDTVLEREQDGQ